jgi:hypothetical protein
MNPPKRTRIKEKGKSYLTNNDPDAPNLNFPPNLTPPLWFEVFVSDDGSAVTQAVFTSLKSIGGQDFNPKTWRDEATGYLQKIWGLS